MPIYRITSENIHTVAKFMAEIKPEWWDVDGAYGQLSSGIGWYFGTNSDIPKGWLLCKSYECYKTCEIECLGFDNNGTCTIGEELQPLIQKSEKWAKGQGFVNMRFTIGSTGLSCHGRKIKQPWEELKDVHAINRDEYKWFLSMGYIPSGILPNIYGDNYHGILLVKSI